ncbi:MAG: Dam family site-specific DNA-(adenine-N6)-methyltransferase [Puniceicoccales bacterium]|nr:Dam family site-specific DNA-(adenine-N6)-methyltransferase [Puniceicoccales bacterium]
MTNSSPRPFIKWVGGKRSIMHELLPRIPIHSHSYFEPFVGGGALFWNMPKIGDAYLSDINFHLTTTYFVVKTSVNDVIDKLLTHKKMHCRGYFNLARTRLHETYNPVEIASLFIYLNKTCYNGLHRVNRAGLFNVPIGNYSHPNILDENNLICVSKCLRNVQTFQHDFHKITPRKNDFVYLDPPYHNKFNAYDSSRFGEAKHKMLAEFCNDLDRSGIFFMLSNSDTEFIRKLFHGYRIEVVTAPRSVSCAKNGKENELIIRNY